MEIDLHYYKRRIGDYAARTAHLSMLEHGAYQLLLDRHYLTEAPLPLETSRLARLVRASGEAELAAIETVLQEFWIRTDDGWVDEAAHAEIERYRTAATAHSLTGKLGGRPKKIKQEPNGNQIGSKQEPNGNQRWLTNNQEPITNNQEPIPIKEVNPPITPPRGTTPASHSTDVQQPFNAAPTVVQPITNQESLINNQESIIKNNTRAKLATPDGVSEFVWQDFLAHRKERKAKVTQTALDGIAREASKAGLPLQAALETICQRGWTGFKADWVADKPATRPEKFDPVAYVNRNRTENIIDITPIKGLL